jgi:predicted DNA-binding protein
MTIDGNIKIKTKLAQKIYKLAKETKKNIAYHMNRAVEEYIYEKEDLEESLIRLKDEDDTVLASKQFRKSVLPQNKI